MARTDRMARIRGFITREHSVNRKPLHPEHPEHPGYLVNPASERLANDRKANDRKREDYVSGDT